MIPVIIGGKQSGFYKMITPLPGTSSEVTAIIWGREQSSVLRARVPGILGDFRLRTMIRGLQAPLEVCSKTF